MRREFDTYKEVIAPFRDGTCWTIRSFHIALNDPASAISKDYFSEIHTKKKISNREIVEAENYFLMAIQDISFLSGLSKMDDKKLQAAFVKQAIISFYYAMFEISACINIGYSGQNPKSHAGTAKAITNLCEGVLPYPFSAKVKNILPSGIRDFESTYITRKQSDKSKPINIYQAKKWYHSALKGTAVKLAENINLKYKKEHQKRISGEEKKKADSEKINKSVCYLDLFYRLRLKAQYSDATFLAFAADNDIFRKEAVETISNMCTIAAIFFQITFWYADKRFDGVLFKNYEIEKIPLEMPELLQNTLNRAA